MNLFLQEHAGGVDASPDAPVIGNSSFMVLTTSYSPAFAAFSKSHGKTENVYDILMFGNQTDDFLIFPAIGRAQLFFPNPFEKG